MKEIYFLRHGETDYNKSGIVQGGGIDSSLNETGRTQGRHFYEKYRKHGFEVALISTLQRTKQTVASFLEAGLPYETFPQLNEMNWGVHEGKAPDPVMHKEYLDMVKSWESGNFDAKVENGESAWDLQERVTEFLDLLELRPEKRLLVCTHGRTLCALVCLLKEESLTNMSTYKHSNTGLTLARYKNRRFNVLVVNDRQHLT